MQGGQHQRLVGRLIGKGEKMRAQRTPSIVTAILTAITTLTGCAGIEPKPIQGPNGRPGYTMACSGLGRSIDACYEKAGTLCPNGYNVVDRPASYWATQDVAGTRQGLVIECK